MWIREPTPVTTSIMTAERLSMSRLNGMYRLPAWIQGLSNGRAGCETWSAVLGPPPANRRSTTHTAAPNDVRTERQAMTMAPRLSPWSRMASPKMARTVNVRSGIKRMTNGR
jgi:hypothetical protein